ncbi:MAG TPA: M17 family peptidase N-terminal domain-containing protein, partial [Polyangiaceae bacterium]
MSAAPKVTSAERPRVPEPPAAGDPSFRLNDAEVERALSTGEYAWELERRFGETELAELRALAREAAAQRRRGGPRVLILPGIMGSKLGIPGRWFDDVYWLDPLDFAFSAKKLRLDATPSQIQPLGVFLSVYLRLKLSLLKDGFDADFYPFDWRRGIRGLGDELRARLERETAGNREVSVVAHSMGGLVARSALRAGARVRRLVMLGTPSYGSFAPVLALRGVYPLVKKLAVLDLNHDARQLATEVFSTFPGLCEMLPSPERFTGLDFFDRGAWPDTGPVPTAKLLREAARLQTALAPADDRCFLIAGINQSTVVGARVEAGELVYATSSAGDGTVPWELARLDGVKTWFVQADHGVLPAVGSVIRAVSELLDSGSTRALPDVMPPERRAASGLEPEVELAQKQPFGGRSREQLTPAELRALLDGFAAPAPRQAVDLGVPATADAAPLSQATPFNRLTVGRVSQQRLEIHLAHASLTDVEARAYVLGLFREVKPSGAASVLDDYLGGAVTEFMRRRMFSGGVGEVFVMPANRRQLRADLVIFAGLGYFDQFNDEVQRVAAQNVVRALVRTRVEEFATVLVGASTGADVAHLLTNLLSGFVEGKLQADSERRLSRIVLCETDPARYEELRREVYRLASTSLFENIEVTLTELEVAPAARLVVEPPRTAREPERAVADPVYLLVREAPSKNGVEYQSSVLGAGEKAAVFTSIQSPKPGEVDKALDELARKVSEQRLDLPEIDAFGRWLAERTLGEAVPRILSRMQGRHLVVVHDSEASRLPWEALCIGTWRPALGHGVSRRYMATNLSVAKYL